MILKSEMLEKVKALLRSHEGLRLNMYLDTLQNPTIGYGHNLAQRGISLDIAETLLMEDINSTTTELIAAWPGFLNLTTNRKVAILDMAYNLGVPRFMGFERTIACLEADDNDGAAHEILTSLWASQVPNRAKDIAKIIRTDEL